MAVLSTVCLLGDVEFMNIIFIEWSPIKKHH